MDFEILPQMIIVFSAAGILLIVGKNFSKVKEASREEDLLAQVVSVGAKAEKEKMKFMYLYKRAVRRIKKENYQKAIARFWIWMEKFLRKLRISFLKIDGKMVLFLDSVREKNAQSFEKLKETERSIRKNMENDSYARFWNMKRGGIDTKRAPESVPENDERKENDTVITAGDVEVVEAIASVEIIGRIKKEKTAGEENKVAVGKVITADEQYTHLEVAMSGDMEKAKIEHDEPAVEAESVQEETGKAEGREETGKLRNEEDSQEDNQRIRTRKEQEYIEMLMKNPADIKAYWKLGLIYSKRRNYDDALACFRQIVKIDPTYTKAKQKALELMEKMKRK